MVRAYLPILGGLALWGCASAYTIPAGTDVAVSLARETDPATARTTLSATFVNRSGRPLCFRSDGLINPDTTEAYYKVIDRAGRTVFSNAIKGYIPEPMPGLHRLEPGSSIRARYNLYPRARPATNADGSAKRLRARLRFQYYRCEAELKPGGALIRDLFAGQSGWQWV